MNPATATRSARLPAGRPTTRRRGRVQSPVPEPKVVRCAIYTRKSTNEGLDSDFSSIDNQREACEAYIQSQKAEGWTLIEERFDDGGFSGGTVERPALKRLMALIEAGEIDCVVVYKIDRLSRSLLDFVRLLEIFEQRNVSFVAVTQQINTSTSAGRLMLHVLVSFAEFERSIGSERTREKIHAARKKGRYTGGAPPLGYDVDRVNHRLVVSPQEAEVVRHLYALYLEHRSLLTVVEAVNSRGWTKKAWKTGALIRRGGRPFDKVCVQRILTNPVYIGLVTLKGEIYPGLHEAIVDDVIFDQVQRILRANRNGASPDVRNKYSALLKGLLRCGSCGGAMTPTYTRKTNRLYRYYRCSSAEKRGLKACSMPPVSAGEIEAKVVDELRKLASDPALVDAVFAEALSQQGDDGERLEAERTRLVKERLQRKEAVGRLVSYIESGEDGTAAEFRRRLDELHSTLILIEDRLSCIDSELTVLNRTRIDRTHLEETLRQFTDIWDALYPPERCRLVRSIVSKVILHEDAGTLQIEFQPPEVRKIRPSESETPDLSPPAGSPNPR